MNLLFVDVMINLLNFLMLTMLIVLIVKVYLYGCWFESTSSLL